MSGFPLHSVSGILLHGRTVCGPILLLLDVCVMMDVISSYLLLHLFSRCPFLFLLFSYWVEARASYMLYTHTLSLN